MKKIILILSLVASLGAEAQYVTTFAKNVQDNQEDGIFYYLPRTVIRLEFTVEETDYYIGPYAEFASKLLEINDIVRETKSEFKIMDVDIQWTNEADPNAVYFIASDEKNKDPLPNVILDVDGVIMAVGLDSIPAKSRIERQTCKNNGVDVCERLVPTFVEILDNDVELDDDDDGNTLKIKSENRAKAAVEKIYNIRTAYFDLVAGTNEVAYGEAISYMADGLKNLENEYLSLFKGKIVKSTYKKVYYFTPDKSHQNSSASITKMSANEGIIDMNSKGDLVKIQFESRNSMNNVKQLADDTKKNAQIGKIFYRLPAETNVKVMTGNKILAEKVLTINQFGDVRIVSVKGNKILFNPNTGQIISITH